MQRVREHHTVLIEGTRSGRKEMSIATVVSEDCDYCAAGQQHDEYLYSYTKRRSTTTEGRKRQICGATFRG